MQGRFKASGVFLLLVSIALIPLLLAHYVFNNSSHLKIKKRNHGHLMTPISVSDLQVIAKGSKEYPISHWSGRWVLAYDTQGACCDKQCLFEMHQLHQVRIALHNGIERAHTVLLLPEKCPTPSLETPDQVWKLSEGQMENWKSKVPGNEPQVLVIDPNSWVSIKYGNKVKPKSIYEDMRILLHVSQIG